MIHPPRQEYLDMILHETTKRLFASTTFSVIKERFLETGADIYPKQALEEMLRDKYDPIIISYPFADSPLYDYNFIIQPTITELCSTNEWTNNTPPFHIALGDLPPHYFSLAEEIVREVKQQEYSGLEPGLQLLIWLKQEEYSVSLLEHSNILRWKREAEGDRELKKQLLHGESVLEDAGVAISHYTDIQRDVHNLQELNQFRPGVIAISTMHALAYDMLLNRDGSRSFYFPRLHPEQLVELSLRSEVHSVYRERMKR